MKAYVVDAFSNAVFSGNQAGVVLTDGPLDERLMQNIAAEFKHSETAFVRIVDLKTVAIRYFTPEAEVDLCGHATVASFALINKMGVIADGEYALETRAGRLCVSVRRGEVWMDMAKPVFIGELTDEDAAELYRAYGLDVADGVEGMRPALVSTGLADIIMPVKNREKLLGAVQDEAAVAALSKRLCCVGVHMFAPGEGHTAFCSNFAPLYGIKEECATGTANGALTYYLYRKGRVKPGEINSFMQGEHMARPSTVLSVLTETEDGARIRIGGGAVVSMECRIMPE